VARERSDWGGRKRRVKGGDNPSSPPIKWGMVREDHQTEGSALLMVRGPLLKMGQGPVKGEGNLTKKEPGGRSPKPELESQHKEKKVG